MGGSHLYRAIQAAVFLAIEKPSFSGALPPLSNAAWLQILAGTSASRRENERLEFLGDALMYATIGQLLFKQIPDGTPALYTETRAALHSNATFSRLAEKLDILAVDREVLDALTRRTFGEGSFAPSKTHIEVKATGDLFETCIGAYFLECGFEQLFEWVADLYAPLIATAEQAYFDNKPVKKRRLAAAAVGFLSQKPRLNIPTPKKRKRVRTTTPIYSPIKSKLSSRPRSPRSPLLTPSNRRILTQTYKTIVPRPPLALRLTTPKRSILKSKPLYIDLTVASDEDEATANVSRVRMLSTSGRKPTNVVVGLRNRDCRMAMTGDSSKECFQVEVSSDMDLESSSGNNHGE